MRLNDWQEKLAAEIKAARKKSFAYGAFDCALFAADCVRSITGVDYAAELRGYTSKTAAYRIVSQFGSMESMVSSLLGSDPIHPSFASTGDVVLATAPLAPDEQGECIGVCFGVRFYAPQGIGLCSLPMTHARLAWRIE